MEKPRTPEALTTPRLSAWTTSSLKTLEHEEWTQTRFGPVRRLPKLQADDAAAQTKRHDASQASGGGVLFTAKELTPRHRKLFRKGAPYASAVAREAAQRAAPPTDPNAVYGESGSAHAAMPAAVVGAALQQDVAAVAGLDVLYSRAPLSPTPPDRLGYAHDRPTTPRPPHVAGYAIEALRNGVGIAPAADLWSSRTARASESRGIAGGGPHSLIMSEVETLLQECGVSGELMADAGLSTDEATRLLHALYVHSQGFLQLLADQFAHLPHRARLLRATWAGFATLLERAKIAGADDVTYESAFAALHRENGASQAALHSKIAELQADLDAVRAAASDAAATAEERQAALQQRLQSTEARAAETATQYDATQKMHDDVATELKSERESRARLEKEYEAEMRTITHLRSQAAALTGARQEARAAQAQATKRANELQDMRTRQNGLYDKIGAAQASYDCVQREMRLLEDDVTALHRVIDTERQQHNDNLSERAAERQLLESDLTKEREHRAAGERRIVALRRQMEEAEDATKRETDARSAAETKVKVLELSLEEAHDNISERDAEIAQALEKQRALTMGNDDLVYAMKQEEMKASELGKARDAARKAEAAALAEIEEAQAKQQAILDALAACRDEARVARNELDQVKLQCFRDTEALRNDMHAMAVERDGLASRTDEASESVAVWEARVQQLETSLQSARAAAAEREEAHQEQLVAQQKNNELARRADAEALGRLARLREDDTKALAKALSDVDALDQHLSAMQADVARLTHDNATYAAEVAGYQEALVCVYELHSTRDQGLTISSTLDALREEVGEALGQSSAQQRCLDMASRELANANADIEHLQGFIGQELQPLADEAAASTKELPLVREELLQASLLRSEALGQLRVAQDAAESVQHKYNSELAGLSRVHLEASEHATRTTDQLASDLAQAQHELADAMEELQLWRTGDIRLSNAKQWREEKLRSPESTLQNAQAAGSPAAAP